MEWLHRVSETKWKDKEAIESSEKVMVKIRESKVQIERETRVRKRRENIEPKRAKNRMRKF